MSASSRARSDPLLRMPEAAALVGIGELRKRLAALAREFPEHKAELSREFTALADKVEALDRDIKQDVGTFSAEVKEVVLADATQSLRDNLAGLSDDLVAKIIDKVTTEAAQPLRKELGERSRNQKKSLDGALSKFKASVIDALKGQDEKILGVKRQFTTTVKSVTDALGKIKSEFQSQTEAHEQAWAQAIARAEEIKAIQPKQGPIGPMPKHQVKDGKIRFERDVGKWGKWIDITRTILPVRNRRLDGGGGGMSGLNKIEVERVICEFLKDTTVVQGVTEYHVLPTDHALYVRAIDGPIDVYLRSAADPSTCPVEVKRSEDSPHPVNVYPVAPETIESQDCRIINLKKWSLRLKIYDGNWKEY